jgi:formylglycine-generating enzyme required for sulfatase activity
VSRIFLSHSSVNNAEAVAVRDWMAELGWDDVFLDLDPERGLKAGDRWQEALKSAARRCELVLFLISPEWASSKWCLAEFLLAKNLGKRVVGVMIAPTPFAAMPIELTSEWQIVDLVAGNRDRSFTVALPPDGRTAEVTFASDGLDRLRFGLLNAGLDAKYFEWPPSSDPDRSPYRGLRPLEADDAGIFFGREAPIVLAIDQLRGLTEAAPPRLLVVLGASGAGKSSFLRAGLLPRLNRDPRKFVPLPIVRPERLVLTGEGGLIRSLAVACEGARLKLSRSDIREAVNAGATGLRPLLHQLRSALRPTLPNSVAPRAPTLVLSVDQAEELFLAEAEGEAAPFLKLLRELLQYDDPSIIAIFAIRSDNYEQLQEAAQLADIHKEPLDLGPMPKGSYAEVVRGPIRRLQGTERAVKIDDKLVDELLIDMEAGAAKDALPLLAFTLERLYNEYSATGRLTLDQYGKLGGLRGSIEAAVERVMAAADLDARIPHGRDARLDLLRRGLVPWLAGIDPDTRAPRRRVARLIEIPMEARPLIELLVQQRLLSTDVARDTGQITIEPAHEALLRQWGLLQGWLEEDAEFLIWLDGVKRAARDWKASGMEASWLAHSGERLRYAERLLTRPDLVGYLGTVDREYVDACQREERRAKNRRRRVQALISCLAIGIGAVATLSYTGLLDQAYLRIQARRLADAYFPSVLADSKELALKPGDTFQECASCPEMVVLPSGEFLMGSPDGEGRDDERPQHRVRIARPFAVSKFEVTFDQWDACVAHGGCSYEGKGASWGRGQQPMIRVSWADAIGFTRWLTRQTGKPYRLLTEAEWEYAARGGSVGPRPQGVSASNLGDFAWFAENSGARTRLVGGKQANRFGLQDMHGNVWEWVQDCYFESYRDAPADGTAAMAPDCINRVLRGGSWRSEAEDVRSAARYGHLARFRSDTNGFRVARELLPAP